MSSRMLEMDAFTKVNGISKQVIEMASASSYGKTVQSMRVSGVRTRPQARAG